MGKRQMHETEGDTTYGPARGRGVYLKALLTVYCHALNFSRLVVWGSVRSKYMAVVA